MKFSRMTNSVRVMALLVTGFVVTGCGKSGPSLTDVKGSIKLDGKPLAGAQVTFHPVSGSRPSYGITDASGNYSLKFTQDRSGSLEGDHLVRISTWSPPVDDGKTTSPGSDEKVPAAYNDKAEETAVMKKTVKGKVAVVDFELDSKVGPLPKRPTLRAAKSHTVTRRM
ncbi:carboxypeptidase regulatory-like domain-containing protein [Schlesneria sp.]|uniref:carboxypeptidase regulatory-like domain-containing protein n=1 Tax=Schlesneria sp. TaxID=2762018 RepID=UPI003F7F9FEA